MLDYSTLGSSIAAGLATHHLARLTSEDKTEVQNENLNQLISVLMGLHKFLVDKDFLENDIFKVVTLYQTSFGPPWVPSQLQENRQYVRILVPAATVISVISILAPPFPLSFVAPSPSDLWTPWDFPDTSSFILDATAPNNQQNIYVRYTNMPPSI